MLRLIALAFLLGLASPAASQEAGVDRAPPGESVVSVYLSWTATCPHCTKAREYLSRLVAKEPRVRLRPMEIDGNRDHEAAFIAVSQRFRVEPLAVPLIVVGDTVFVGYGGDATSGIEIEKAIRHCVATVCADLAGPIIAQSGTAQRKEESVPEARQARPPLPETIWLPGVGNVATRSLALPALTIVLAAVDGFNPCAMWVLVLLIGLLIGMRDRVRMELRSGFS